MTISERVIWEDGKNMLNHYAFGKNIDIYHVNKYDIKEIARLLDLGYEYVSKRIHFYINN